MHTQHNCGMDNFARGNHYLRTQKKTSELCLSMMINYQASNAK